MDLASPQTVSHGPAAAGSTRGQLRCEVFTDLSALDSLTPSWQALLGRSACNEPVLNPLWLLNWWRVFGSQDGRQLRVAGFFHGDRLIGLAPLLRRRWWYRPGIPFRRLEFLSTGERPEDAIHPDYLSILAERGAEAEVASALTAALSAGVFGGWDELVLAMMSGDNPLLPVLAETLHAAGWSCRQEVTATASYIPLPATWEEYLQQLSSSRRAYVRQSERRFERWAGKDAQLHCVAEPAQLEEGKQILAALHQGRWGAGGGKFGSPHFAAFHDAVMPALLEAGALDLLWLSVRGEPIVAAYNIVWNDKVYFYQSGRKLEVPTGVRPGIVLHAYAIRRAIEAGRREYDFLSGGEHYKGQLALATRNLVQLRVVRRGLVEGARVVAEAGISCLRALRNRVRARLKTRTQDAPPVDG